jgi:DNA polymerase
VGAQPHHGAVEFPNRMIEAASALAWLAAAGADVIVDEAPRNWLATPPRPAPEVRPDPVRLPAARAAPSAPASPKGIAAGLAQAAGDIGALGQAIAEFAHPLRQTAPPQLIDGNIASGVIVLADQPDAANSDASRLQGRMLAAIGLDDSQYARAHLLPWSLPAGRAPRDEEIAAYAPFLARAITLTSPRLILAFGDKAAGLARTDREPLRGIASMRGKWLAIGDVPMMATFHPRQLLVQPELKRLAWADLQAFQLRVVRQ